MSASRINSPIHFLNGDNCDTQRKHADAGTTSTVEQSVARATRSSTRKANGSKQLSEASASQPASVQKAGKPEGVSVSP